MSINGYGKVVVVFRCDGEIGVLELNTWLKRGSGMQG
jgi:hypothetical protein